MRYFYTRFLILSPLFFSLLSCEDVVELPLDSKPELVVFSNFSDKNGLEVFVYKTQSAYDSSPTEYVKDAKVRVYKDTALIEDLVLVTDPDPTKNIPPYYKTLNLFPEFDVEYTIEVDVEGFKPITAQNSVPTPVNLEEVTFEPSVSAGVNNLVLVDFDVSISLKDPIAVANYYHLKFYQELTTYSLDANRDTIRGTTYLKFPTHIEVMNNSSPIIKYQKEQSYLIEDSQFNGQYITLDFKGQYTYDPAKSIPGRFLVELRTVSEAYYLYHESLNRQIQNGSDHLGEGVVVYNNIDNGLGNFSGFTSKTNFFKLSD